MTLRQTKLAITKKKKRRKRIFWFLIFPILLFVSIGTTYGIHLYKKAEKALNEAYDDSHGKSDLRNKKVNPKIDNVSILLIGVDGGEKRGFKDLRSDALMVATLNEKEKSVKLLSIPRDSYVYIPEVDYSTKINHAYKFGEAKASIETIELLLDIPIDYYVAVNFEAFMEIIDALEGIEIEVPYTITEQNSKDQAGAITIEEGLQHLNGEEALAFARTRKKDTDVERGKRQQQVIQAILNKAKSVSSLPKYGSVIEAIGSNMRTNMTFDEMTSFIDYGISGNLDIETLVLTGNDLYLPNNQGKMIYYWELDEDVVEQTTNKLKEHLGSETNKHTNSQSSLSTNFHE